jgi:Putative beta-barrel porin-2, OmpL-like. bbp2
MTGESKPAALLSLARPLIALAALSTASVSLAEEEKTGAKVADSAAAQPEATTAPSAETAPPPAVAVAAAATEAEPEPWYKQIKLEGLIDTYYSYNFARPYRAPSTFRVFDAENMTFMLAYAEVAASFAPAPVGFRLDLGFGPVADLTASPDTEIFKHIQQAYGSLAIGETGWVVDAGKFVTTAGAELIEARLNWNYSRSFLFGFAIPFTHTGIRVGGPLTSTFSLQASLVNGWEVVDDNNRFKTLGLSGTFAPPTGTTVILTLYGGPELDEGNPWRLLADAVVLQKIGDKLTVGANGDYGREGSGAKWYGAAVMAEYKFSPLFRLAARAEQFRDPDGVRGIGATVSEGTITAGFGLGSNAEVRAELRGDTSPDPVFRGSTDNNDNQATAQVALLAWF